MIMAAYTKKGRLKAINGRFNKDNIARVFLEL